jgi:signal transduction histidine kinase/DNA-binding response OmpR family regulator/ligand-binding sensor domain-containing protein
MMKRSSLLILFVLLHLHLLSQEFHHYDITDGLSSIEVTDIKENENFLWIATCDGLNRFDGENFKIFKRESGSSNCLSENNIETLFFDSDGFLWIGLKTGGADIYDPKKEQFVHLNRLIREKIPSRVISIMEDSEGNIWLGTWEEGVYKLTPDGRETKYYRAEIHYTGYIVSDMIEKPKGFVRIGTYFGSFVYNMKNKVWVDTDHKDKAITEFIDTGEENSLWCSTWSSGLLKIGWDNHNPASMDIVDRMTGNEYKSIYRIIEGNKNEIYLGTWGEGLKIVNVNHPEGVFSLANENFQSPLINCLFRDKYSNIWIGTYGGGIYTFNLDNNGMGHIPVTDKLPAPVISLASFGENQVLIGTQGSGVFLCDLENGHLSPKFSNSGTGELSNYILSLYSDKDFIFAGHDGFGIPFAIKDKSADADFTFNELLTDNRLEKVTAFFPSQDGRIWIGTKQDGLISVKPDLKNKKLKDYIHYDSFGRDEITGFAEFDDDHLFISSHNGLFLFNTLSNQITGMGRIIENEIVYRIVGDSKNNCLWIGTSTKLLRLDFDQPDRVQNAMPVDMLPQGAIRVMMLDYDNNLWFAIGEKLFCIIDHEKKVKELNPDLLGNHTILSCTRAAIRGEPQLIFGTTDNLIVATPHLILNQPELSKILFTELQIDHKKIRVGEEVFGNVVLNEATEYVRSIRLSYKCRWISFSFAETGWDLYKNKFQYRIKGFSDAWEYLDLSNPITFSHFNPGEYRIEIRKYEAGQDAALMWSMDFIITPPWWKTAWFYILLALVVILSATVAAMILFNFYRRRHLLKLKAVEKQKEEELLKEKESFFTGLSHDLLTPFSLILAPVNDLIRESRGEDPNREKLEIIRKNTSFLSDIFATILDFKRAELTDSQLKESNVEIVSFARIVLNAFDYLAKSRKISLSFQSSIESLNILTDNVKVERILYNLLSNALKNTPEGGAVALKLDSINPGELSITVIDNGYGIDAKSQSFIFDKFYKGPVKSGTGNLQGLGLGLYIVKKFIDMLNGSIEVASSPETGTRIKVNLPVKTNTAEEKPDQGKDTMIMEEGTSTILIAEDNPEMLEYIRKKLAVRFNIITATNGKDALDAIEKYLPEIIITDVMMPVMDGLALCSAIKNNGRYADIFVVVLTAKTSTEDELQGYKMGADIYLKKPFDSEVLLNQMVNIHNTRQRRKSQLISNLISRENSDIEFDAKETFLKRSMQVIEDHIMDAGFNIEAFADEMNMSRTVLHRKFKLLVGQTPNQFTRLVRLRKSVHLLRNSDHTITEIAYLTGFNQSHYFIKCFREVYQETPKSFRDSENGAMNSR